MMSLFLCKCFLDSLRKLVGTRCTSAVAVIAFEYPYSFRRTLTFKQLGYCFQVAVAAALERNSAEFAVLEVKAYFSGTDPLGGIIISSHGITS